jgi:hypothetical protein
MIDLTLNPEASFSCELCNVVKNDLDYARVCRACNEAEFLRFHNDNGIALTKRTLAEIDPAADGRRAARENNE